MMDDYKDIEESTALKIISAVIWSLLWFVVGVSAATYILLHY